MSENKKTLITAKMVAKAAKSSEVLVRKVRAGKRQNGKVATRVQVAEQLLDEGVNKLIAEVQRVVNF
jgi:hypothetical protein